MTDDLAVLVHELRTPVAALDAIVETLAARGATLTPEQRRRFVELAIAAVAMWKGCCRRHRRRRPRSTWRASSATSSKPPPRDATTSGRRSRTGSRRSPATPAGLRQALRNLVENGLAHGPPVVVRARSDAGAVAIAVSDEGDGIAAADQERIFERGTRLTDTRPGSGLGLAVVRAVAEEHGGSVVVSSSPGQGATFTLVLPPASATG